jgi:hypothetical protein
MSIKELGDAAAGPMKHRMELIEAERNFLYELLRDGKITDESRPPAGNANSIWKRSGDPARRDRQ